MNKKFLNESVNPGENFWKYATGNWLTENPQPDDHPSWDSFDVISENVDKQLKEILNNLDRDNDIMSKKICDFYSVMTDYEKRNSEGFLPLKPYINKIYSLDSKEAVIEYCMSTFGVEMFVNTGLAPDEKNSDNYEVHLEQSLTLGNKEYYVGSVENQKVLNEYIKVSKKILNACDYFTDDKINSIVDTYFKYEKEIANLAYSYEDLNKPELNYHDMNVDDASVAFNYNIRRYLHWQDLYETDWIIVGQVEAVKKGFEILNKMTLDELKDCAAFCVINENVSSLSENFGEIAFEFNKFLTGAKKRIDKWKREVHLVNDVFKHSIGKIYAERYFGRRAKNKMIEMIKNIINSYSEIMKEQSWMSDETKEVALDKLHSMTYKIGYPDVWKDYSDMPVDASKSFFEMMRDISLYKHYRFLKDCYNKKVDRNDWPMMPQTVNACYMPTENDICFPAGILQAPFFDADATDAENYGGIGVVIGHEITHGFDTCGRLFTKDGNMTDWWKEEDSEKFNELTENTREHFNSLDVLPGLKCDGSLTLNENIADYGGLKIAYRALEILLSNINREVNELLAMKDDNGQPIFNETSIQERYNLYKDGFSWKQLFFISYAQVWSGTDTDECIKNSTLNNCHSVNYMRVNGTLPMFDAWYSAFDFNSDNCKMFVDKNKRARIW